MCWRQLAPDTRHKSSFGLRRQAFASPTQTYAKEVKTHVVQLKVDVFFGDVHAMFQSSFGPALEPQIFSSERSPAQSCSCEPQGHQNLGLGAPLQTHSELSHKPSRVLAQVASRTLNQRARVTNNVPWTQKLHARADSRKMRKEKKRGIPKFNETLPGRVKKTHCWPGLQGAWWPQAQLRTVSGSMAKLKAAQW